jgi:hypothetical protein
VIVLLDRRFTERPYAACLPPHWHATVTDDPVPVLEAFWGEQSTLPAYVNSDRAKR